MNAKALAHLFSALTTDRQVKHLSVWCYAATIDARDTYIPGVEGIADPVRLRRFNELQHQLAGRLVGLVDGSGAGDDELFISAVVEAAKELHAVMLKEKLAELRAEEIVSRPARRRVG